jgi:hypothetical protein
MTGFGQGGSMNMPNQGLNTQMYSNNLTVSKHSGSNGMDNLEQSLFNKMSIQSNRNGLMESKNFNNF